MPSTRTAITPAACTHTYDPFLCKNMPHCKTPTSFSFEVCITVSMEKVGFADLEEERRFSLILLKMFCHMQKKKKNLISLEPENFYKGILFNVQTAWTPTIPWSYLNICSPDKCGFNSVNFPVTFAC